MSSMLNINSLHDEILEREAKKELIYEEVFKKVVDKIKYTNKKSNDCFLLYSCPNFIYGVPRYDLQPCLAYIMKKLTDKYFRVSYHAPNILFISWQHLPPKSASNNHLSYIPSTQHSLLEYQDNKLELENQKSKSYVFNEIDKEFLLNSSKYRGGIEKKKESKRTNHQPVNYNPKPNYYNNKNNYYSKSKQTKQTKQSKQSNSRYPQSDYQVKKLAIDPNYIISNTGVNTPNNNNNYLDNYTNNNYTNNNTNNNYTNNNTNNNYTNNNYTNNNNYTKTNTKKDKNLDDILNELDSDFTGTLL
jgi:hypothetical protein